MRLGYWHRLFQSSPTPKGGRYLQGGNGGNEIHQNVSILAHPERWALLLDRGRALRELRVSILAHPERWALPATRGGGFRLCLYLVSILAHPERWALRLSTERMRFILWFQSSPTPKGGRYGELHYLVVRHSRFQSSPTPKGGRYILVWSLAVGFQSFNPRPPRKVGATRRIRWHTTNDLEKFQSSPTPKGGRYYSNSLARSFAWVQGTVDCFNPRPPRKVGATRFVNSWKLAFLVVSILAHPERWALQP